MAKVVLREGFLVTNLDPMNRGLKPGGAIVGVGAGVGYKPRPDE